MSRDTRVPSTITLEHLPAGPEEDINEADVVSEARLGRTSGGEVFVELTGDDGRQLLLTLTPDDVRRFVAAIESIAATLERRIS